MIESIKAFVLDTCYDLRDHFADDIWFVYIFIAWGEVIMFSGKLSVILGFQ